MILLLIKLLFLITSISLLLKFLPQKGQFHINFLTEQKVPHFPQTKIFFLFKIPK